MPSCAAPTRARACPPGCGVRAARLVPSWALTPCVQVKHFDRKQLYEEYKGKFEKEQARGRA